MVLERAPARVIIGEGSSVGYDFPGRCDSLHCLEVSGTADVARRLGVELVDLNRDEVVMVRAEFAWDDIGAWPALDRTMTRDAHGNVGVGDPVMIDCEDCIVYNEPGGDHVAVGVIGCRDLIVVVTSDGVLVAPKDRAQDVRKVVAELKVRGAPQT